jgi:hypothetical protein
MYLARILTCFSMPTLQKLTALIILCLSFIFTQSYAQNTPGYKQVSAFENSINALCKDVLENGKTTDRLTEKDFADLPVGIARQIGNGTYVIAIDSAYRADKGGWFFSAYASIKFPGTTKPIAFAAKNIGFTKGGLTSTTQIKLLLASPQEIPLNESVSLVLPADGHNFIEFDCSGFKSVNLKGNFIFSDGLLKPDTEIAKGATTVTAGFEINTADLNNIMTTVNITPFKISGLDDVSFEVRNAVVDYSDIVNPSGFIFPQGYQQAYGDDIKLWRGFYLQDLIVRVNVVSDSTASKKGFSIDAHNLLIDDLGVSGTFTATNPLPIKDGSADGWPFSIDELSVTLQLNKIKGGGLKGKLGVPFLGDDPAPYTAQVEQGVHGMNYRFSLETTEAKVYNTPFSAKIRLDKGSIIILEKKENGSLIPSAVLNGALSTDGDVKTDKIRFEKLTLTSKKPYVLGGEFSMVGSGQSSGAGFPISINNIKLKIYPGQIGIGFDVALNLGNSSSSTDGSNKDSEKSFSASTNLEILVKMEEKQITIPASGEIAQHTQNKQEWKFDRVKVNQIKLACHTQAFTLDGTLDFYKEDPVYGNGFHGAIQFCIPSVLKDGVKVNAYFGTKQGSAETFRYWHLDAYVPVGKIMIYPPALFLTGIMGGASYRMVRQQPLVPDFSKLGEGSAANISTGSSNEAMVYIPDETAGISFLAGITMVIANDNAINADIMFEVAFNRGGGLKYVQFNGSAFFMSPSASRDKSANAPKGMIYASMSMLYDNDNKVFHSNLKTYVNIAGIITGSGPNFLVGEAVIHIDQHDWYTYVGRPSQMFGVTILGAITAQTYFMVGTKIENLPLPPPEVREIFGDIDLSLMRDDMASAGGKGFAAGVHLKVAFDSKNKLRPFYVMFAIGGGTDVMVRNYGNVQCVGHSGRIGVNGWYASGQAYVFLLGKVGLRVKRKSFDIVSVGLAALLQAKLPNPAWMRGMLAGRYSVLGGLVKGKFNLKFEVGEECEMLNQGSEIEDIVVIAALKPDNNGTDVSVFTAPQASFNTAIDTDFTMMDLNDNLNSYRIKLDEFVVKNGSTNIQGTIQWNDAKDVAILKTREILPPQSNLKISAKIHWERKVSGGSWEVMKTDNQVFYEVKESSFTTGTAPNFIPEENVSYSYPITHQYNLHVKESGDGYVKLEYGQEYLFRATEGGTTWSYTARFKDAKGKISEVPLSYNAGATTANFSIPSTLEKESIYTLTFIKRPQQGTSIDQNVQRSEVKQNAGDENEMSVQSNTLSGTITQDVEKEIYSQAFRTSKFSTFNEKWTSLGNGNDLFDVATGNVAVIGKRSNTLETFDEYELVGKKNVQPLVQVSASPENTWLKNIIFPLMYDLYPYDADIKIEWRNPDQLGVKPLKGVKLTNNMDLFKLTDDNVTAGIAPSKSGNVLIGYYLSYYTYWDYSELLNKVSAKYLDNWSSRPAGVKKLLSATGYTDLLEGYYPVDVVYTLPGTNKVTFKSQILIKF